MKISSLKAALVAAFAALLFALPASAQNYWHAPMEGSWQMSGAGGNDWLVAVEVGTTEKVNFYKAFDSADVGAFFSYNYNVADFGDGPNHFGAGFDSIKIGANIRFALMDKEKFNLALSIDPAFDIWMSDWGHHYYDDDVNIFGISVDLRLTFGIKIVDRFRVHAGIVIPTEFMFAATDDFFDEHHLDASLWTLMPILVEAGAEFKILPWLSVMLDVRMGPGIKFGGHINYNDADWDDDWDDDLDSGAWFAWETRAGVAFRF